MMNEKKAQEQIRQAVLGSLSWLNELPSQETEILEKANNKIHFTDNECLAIGYVLDNEVTNFVNIYFEYPQTYYNLEEHDFRSPENRTSGYGNRFVLIPKDDSVYITLYDCYLNDDGEIIKDVNN